MAKPKNPLLDELERAKQAKASKRKSASKRTPKKRAGAKPKPAAKKKPRGAKKTGPRGLTVNAECMHTSGVTVISQCVMDGAPLGKRINGIWVSAGALKYATPTAAAVKRFSGGLQVGHLTEGTRQARITAIPESPEMDAVLFDLSEPITLAKGDVLTVRWENKSGKRCGHYVACATKG